jgi:hypothetical protein
MAFELWEIDSRNLAAVGDTEAEALATLHDAVDYHGRHHAESFALVYEDRGGNPKTIAIGADLVERALGWPRFPES